MFRIKGGLFCPRALISSHQEQRDSSLTKCTERLDVHMSKNANGLWSLRDQLKMHGRLVTSLLL